MLLYNEKNRQSWHLRTSIAVFCIYFLAFLGTCFMSTYQAVLEEGDPIYTSEQVFLSKFEKYFCLAVGLFFIVPFSSTVFLIFSLLTENGYYLKWHLISYVASVSILEAFILAGGIYIIVKGTLYVGIIALVYFVVHAVIIANILLLGKYTYVAYSSDHQSKLSDD